MSYDPGTNILFSFRFVYEPPKGNAIEFRLGDFSQVCEMFVPAVGEVDFSLATLLPVPLDFAFNEKCYPDNQPEPIIPKCEEIKIYVAPVGLVDFDFFKPYDWPSGTVDFDLADCLGDDPPEPPPPWYVIPANISQDFAVGFKTGQVADTQKRSRWKDAPYIEPEYRAGWGQGEIVDRLVKSGFIGLPALYRENRVAFDRLLRSENDIFTAWHNLEGNDSNEKRSIWDSTTAKDGKLNAGYREPGAKDNHFVIPWGSTTKEIDFSFVVPWAVPPPNDTLHTTKWGREWYEKICIRDYLPPAGTAVALDFETQISDVGDKDHIHFWFDSLSYDERCRHAEPSGWRDPFTYRPPVLFPHTPNRKAFTHMNSALLKRVSDNMPLDLRSFEAKIDFDSWVWEFSAALNTESSYAAVEPDENGFQEVEANINGYIFRGLVERAAANEERTSNFTLSGRGPAAELARPYAPQSSYTEEQARGLRQLIEDRLTATGWTLDWQITDFIVPADVVSFHNSTPFEAINQLTEAIGARIQANRETQVLQILPRYPIKPWQWDSETPALALGEAVIMTSSRDWQPGGNYNGVVVSGTGQGVIVKVMRTASGGTEMAPMVTDPLIVTTEAATQRGIYEIAASGSWQPYTITLPLKTEPEQPGLLLPGTLLQINRVRESFRCMVTGVKVSAQRKNGLKVRQIVEVERYRGKPVA